MGEPSRPPSHTWTAVGKWFAGVASAVLAAVLIWWLTSSDGPLDKAEPSVRIAALSTFPRAQVGQSPSANLTLRNEGDGTASRCQVLWSPQTDDPADSPYAASTEFSLGPGESREQELRTVSKYTEAGSVSMAAKLVCEEAESAVVTATVEVE
jgi:hypothetical protein